MRATLLGRSLAVVLANKGGFSGSLGDERSLRSRTVARPRARLRTFSNPAEMGRASHRWSCRDVAYLGAVGAMGLLWRHCSSPNRNLALRMIQAQSGDDAG